MFTALQFGEFPQLEITSEIIDEYGKGAIIFINNVSDSDLMLRKMNQFKLFVEGKADTAIIPNDIRDYGIGGQIIKDLNIRKANLITRNPDNNEQTLSGFNLKIVKYTLLHDHNKQKS